MADFQPQAGGQFTPRQVDAYRELLRRKDSLSSEQQSALGELGKRMETYLKQPYRNPEQPMEDTTMDLVNLYGAGSAARAIPGLVKEASSAAGKTLVGKVAKGAMEGFKEGAKNAPPNKKLSAVGGLLGGAGGYAVGRYPGAMLGTAGGAAAGREAGAIGAGIKRAIEIGKLRLRQAKMPPREAPGWEVLEGGRAATPEFEPIPSELPSGRVPGQPVPRATPPEPAPRNPAWKSGPEPVRLNSPDVEPIPSELPSGRVPGRPSQPSAPVPREPTPVGESAPSRPPFTNSAAARKVVARNITIANSLHEAGIKAANARAKFTVSHWEQLAKGMKVDRPNAHSVEQILKELERLERNVPSPKGRLSPPQ